jgi:hypothetical protein
MMVILHNDDLAGGAVIMGKKAVIEVLLVEESTEKTNTEIEKEIREELSENLHVIPWAAKIEKTTVTSR